MKRMIYLFLGLTFVAFVSCRDHDGDDVGNVGDEKTYTFGYSVVVRDINGNSLLSENTKQPIIKALSDKDKAASEITTNEYGDIMNIEIESSDINGVSMHSQALIWEYENGITTDTILCEIEKVGDVTTLKKIWVNDHLKWDIEIPAAPWRITLTKISPKHIGLRDEKSTDSRIEKEVDGIKFGYWLSDMDGNETSLFDRNEVEERGFNFNLSVTNNTNKPISFNKHALYFKGYVLGMEGYEVMRTCELTEDILFTIEVMPGETYSEKRWWCTSDVMYSRPLSSGKYYTYFYNESFNTNERKINIPVMFINFEIK